MKRFDFAFAREFMEAITVYDVKIPEFVKTGEAYLKNQLRLQSAGTLPMLLVGATVAKHHFEVMAMQKMDLKFGDERLREDHPKYDEALAMTKAALREELQMEWYMKMREGKAPSGLTIGERQLHLMAPAGGQEVIEALDSILSGMVIGAWTAFETLSADLWIAALNKHPKKLAALSGKWHKAAKVDPDEQVFEENEQGSDKIVKLHELMSRDYNLAGSMGTIHAGRFKWSLLDGIRSAYGAAFSSHFEKVQAAIEDRSLDALNAARNILVHKAGKIDAKFKGKHKEWQAFAGMEVDSNLLLTGAMVRELLSASMQRGWDLVQAVDEVASKSLESVDGACGRPLQSPKQFTTMQCRWRLT